MKLDDLIKIWLHLVQDADGKDDILIKPEVARSTLEHLQSLKSLAKSIREGILELIGKKNG